MKGFFAASDLSSRVPLSLVPQCGKCGLFRGCESPKMKVFGKGLRKVLIVGEAPGEDEDKQGKPFVGKTGNELRTVLRKIGVELNRDCWTVNSARCRPKDNKLPEKAIDYCRPFTIQDIQELQPETIILLGKSAVKSVIGWLWKEQVGEIGKWIGWKIPHQKLNAWICPAWHPSYVMRLSTPKPNPVVNAMFEEHLRAAFELQGRPWNPVPNYNEQCKTIINPNEATAIIRKWDHSKPLAFDYETNTLKPDSEKAKIVCCSISNGKVSLAYPWHGNAITATKELLESDAPKMGWNAKFEIRWSLKYGIRVKNWKWDGMLAAHILDCRGGISGLKFQSFVQLGVDAYDAEIKSYLQSKDNSGNGINRISEVGLPTALTYCALDSLLEYKLGVMQAKQLGVET